MQRKINRHRQTVRERHTKTEIERQRFREIYT